MISVKLSDLLKAKDGGKGRTIYWLAKQTGISYNNLHRIAAGKAKVMSFDVINTLCETLDCGPSDLFEFQRGVPQPEETKKAKAS